MKRVRLQFQGIHQVMGSDELSVVILTDKARRHALSVICDAPMTKQILMRLLHPDHCRNMLPEALVEMLSNRQEMMVYGLYDGQYQVVLADDSFEHNVRIRMSDAVLLTMISSTPLYIEETLFLRQAVAFEENARGIAIPINTMDMSRLNTALQKAIDEENYELASQLRDEIKRRVNQEKE